MSTYKYLWDSVLADILTKAGPDGKPGSGFTGKAFTTAFGVIQGESAGDPYEYNPNSDSTPKRPIGWWEGGLAWDLGLCQWNVYYHLADPTHRLFGNPESEFYLPDKATAIKKAYNPIWSVRALYAFTEGGSKNWSTWNAYTDGGYALPEFAERAERALEKVVAGQVSTAHTHTIGGSTPLRAASIPARCNPPISWGRFARLNPTVKVRRKVAGKVIVETLPLTPDLMLPPGTDLGVNYTTTRLAAGPLPGGSPS